MDGPITGIEHRFSVGLPCRRTRGGGPKCRGINEQKEANESEIISDREIWSAIRYLDPESDHRECDIAAAVAIVAVICIVCMVVVLFHFRGL
jgi:hypothetical protein